jgi:D-arabinose 1-dehydrogenase-like Zn-dependent alcohol dehydrogenase
MTATKVRVYAAQSATSALAPMSITRHEPGPLDVEVIPIQKVNEACERLLKSNVKYRFSIDMASLKSG